MGQKGIASLFLIIGILAITILIGSSIYYFVNQKDYDHSNLSYVSNNPTLTNSIDKPLSSSSPKNQPSVHLADNPNISLGKIKIMAILFVPKDVEPPQENKWRNLAQDWNKDVISFWENVLDHKSSITFEALPQVIKGEKNASEYDYNGVYQELWPKLSTTTQLEPYFSGQSNEFLTLFVYVLSNDQHFYKDSGRATHIPTTNSAIGLFIGSMDHKFELLDKARGGIPAEEAHELGHAFGLQHSTDDPRLVAKYLNGNVWTSACDLMLGSKIIGNESFSYTQNKDWDNAKTLQELDCIIPEQKKLFFE